MEKPGGIPSSFARSSKVGTKTGTQVCLIVTSTDTVTGTSADTGTLTSTDTLTGTTSYGTGLSITGGNSWQSSYETGTDSPSQTATDTATVTESATSAFASSNATTNLTDVSTLTGTHTLIEAGASTLTSTATTTMTLGAAGLITGGNISNTLNENGWSTDTLTGTTTQTDHDWSNVSDNSGNASNWQTTTLTATTTLTSSQSDSLGDTQNNIGTITLGASATISTGSNTTTLTSSGHSFFSDYETDNDSSTITGASSSNLGAAVSSSNFNNMLTAAPVIQSWGTTTLGSSTTESMTLGANGMVTAGTTTEAGSTIQTSTYTLSEVQTTTESVSTSSTDSAAGNTDNLLGRTTLTGTMTDTITDPLTTSTLTDTNSSTVTVGVSDVVSGGSLTDSLYQTGNNLTTDYGTGTLSSTETSTLTATNSGQSTSGATTITDTLTDNSVASSGSPTTLTQTETMTLGSNAVISSGQQATTLIGTGWGTDSLYQVVNESFSTGSGSNQGGSMNLNANVALSGSGASTLTVTDTDTLTTTHIATVVLGSNATISSGWDSDSLYETGNDSTTGPSSGTRVHQFVYSGQGNQSSTFTTNFSGTDSQTDWYTESQSDVANLGAAGLTTLGTDISSLTDTSTSYSTLSENGGCVISDSQNYNSGSYCDTESYTVSSSQFDSTSLALGTSGTITGGTDSQSEAGFNSSSQSYILTGNAYLTDPDGGPAYGAYVSQLSIVTDSLYSSDQGTLTFGSLGTVSGGNDCFTFIQANSASHLINESTPSDNITDSGTDYYSQAMTGTETLGTGGSVASGSDSFSWTETASDMYTLVQYGGGTSGLYNEYQLTLLDQMYEGFTDTGTDILGSSDSILGGTDTYTSVEQHNLWSTLVANGTSANPYYISASDWDLLTQRDVGSSTLTTNGHVYATDTITYIENTGAAAIDDQTSSTSGPGWQQNWQCNGYAYDNYNNNNTTTQTISDTLTTTVDNFAVSDTHSISDSYNETSVSAPSG